MKLIPVKFRVEGTDIYIEEDRSCGHVTWVIKSASGLEGGTRFNSSQAALRAIEFFRSGKEEEDQND